MTVRVVAVDDEPLALRGLEHLLRDMEGVVLVGTASGCQSARKLIRERTPDVLLLDIKMRDGSGLDLAQELAGGEGPAIVFVSAYDRFAIRAFDVSAADYVLKPADPQRLHRAIDRARAKLGERHSAERMEEMQAIIRELRSADALSPDPSTDNGQAELWIRRHQGDFVKILPEQIGSIEAEGDYVRIHVGERSYLHRASISALERQFNGLGFVRIHRASLVRFGAIVEVRRTRLGMIEVVLADGRALKAGRVHAKALRDRLAKAR